MTPFTPPPAPGEVEAFIGQVITDLSAAFSGVPPAQAMVLALDQSPIFMAPAFEVAASFWLDEDKIVETFRSGEGLGWRAHNHRLFCGTESFFLSGYRAQLVNTWLPALENIAFEVKTATAFDGRDFDLVFGAQAGEERLREVAREAGFSNLRRAAQTRVNLILELTL
jgi:hypothetical protein